MNMNGCPAKEPMGLPHLILALLAGMVALGSPAVAGEVIPLDPHVQGAEYEGIGAVSAGASSRLLIDYPEPERSRILDWLFLPQYGAGFQHLKVEVGGEINSTDGTEPTHARTRSELTTPKREYFERGYEWWLMSEAVKRNPGIVLDCLPWGAPGWIGGGQYYSQDMADYLVGFLRGAREYHRLNIRYVGVWNEKDNDANWIKLLRQTLDANGFGEVRIVGGDMNGPPEQQWKLAEAAAKDPELARCLHAIGVHYTYGEQPNSVAHLKAAGVRIWASEQGEWDWATMQPYFHQRSSDLNRLFLDSGVTKVEFWSPVTSYYDCLPAPGSGVITANTPWSGAFEIMPTLWSVAHYTQFVVPGWRILKEVGRKLPQGGSLVGFSSPDGEDVSIVIDTTGAKGDQELNFSPQLALAQKKLHVWRTDQMEQFIRNQDLNLTNGLWTLTVNPNCTYTLTTTVGQRKGEASGPTRRPFPLPYKEDFEGYTAHSMPRVLCDQGGAFEVVDNNEGGHSLRQQVSEPGIDWSKGTYAYSVLGDDHWTDISISVNAAFEATTDGAGKPSDRSIGILARWNPGATWLHFYTPNPAGYCLRLYESGRWQVATARSILAEGKVESPRTSRQHLSLRCQGARLQAGLNGHLLAEITDYTYQRGLVGIYSGFHASLFDDIVVESP